jgi:Restriction endonuclease S subunits
MKLGEIVEVSAGQAAPQDPMAFGLEGHPFVRAGSLEHLCSGGNPRSLEYISHSVAAKYKLKLFPAGTILFAKSGMSAKIGRVFKLIEPSYVVSHLATLTPTTRVDADYLVHYLIKHPPSNLIPNDAYPSIRLSEIENLDVPSPPLDEQRRIAAILDKADAVRRKRQEILKLVDDLVKSQFIATAPVFMEAAA